VTLYTTEPSLIPGRNSVERGMVGAPVPSTRAMRRSTAGVDSEAHRLRAVIVADDARSMSATLFQFHWIAKLPPGIETAEEWVDILETLTHE
jgi:hypothetical protein